MIKTANHARANYPRAVILFLALVLSGCSRDSSGSGARGASPGAGARPAVPVSVGTVTRRDVPEQILGIGSVEPIESVTIKPQVDAQLLEARFAEGQELEAGALILLLDSRPFEAELAEAQAMLARDTAMAQDLERAAELVADALKSRASSQRESDKARADSDAAQAQVQSDLAAVNAARLRVEYCSIRSPIAGSAGALMIRPGNVVKQNESELVQINQIAPIYVSFAVPEQNLGRIRDFQALSPLAIEVRIPGVPGDLKPPIAGTLSFIDNRVDSTTGTIRLKGTIANVERRLWPGQFVTVVLTLTTERGALVAPSAAVQVGQNGQFVFVVKPDRTVEQRVVEVGMTTGHDTVIRSGLNDGETVVTDGQLRLIPGSSVEIKNQAQVAERAP